MSPLIDIYNNHERPNKDEIFTYYPAYYRDIVEMDAIVSLAGKQCDDAADAMSTAANNRFVDRMDEETTSRMEEFYFLTANSERTLDERRTLVKSTLLGFGKISVSRIKDIIATFTNSKVEITFPETKLIILITKSEESTLYLTDIMTSIKKRIPAHIGIEQTVKFSHSTVVTGKMSVTCSYNLPHAAEKPYSILL